MTDPQTIFRWVVAISVGLALGVFFFGGLWVTLRKLPTVRHPGLWILTSYVLRLLAVAAGFIALTRFGLTGIIGGLAGVLAARYLVIRHSQEPRFVDLPDGGVQ